MAMGIGRSLRGRVSAHFTAKRVVIVATVLLVAVARAFAQQTVFRTETDLVSFGVTVVDRRGDFLTDLTGEHFEILESRHSGFRRRIKLATSDY